jgi:signal transduction histidine kinase
MVNFTALFINFTWILLPITIYLIYEVYVENIDINKNELVLNFCLFSSLYLMFRFGSFNNIYIFSIVFDFIVLLFYIKKNIFSSLLVSFIVIYLCYIYGFNLYIFSLKFILYLFMYLLFKGNKKFMILCFIIGFLFLCSLFLINSIDFYSGICYVIYYFSSYFLILFFLKAEKIVEINISYKELMRQNQLRESLFKISHEIKNPIAVCKGYLDMFDINNMSHFEKYIPIIKSEINKTLNLLQDFSACSKVKIECDIIDISLLISDIVDNFKLMFDNNNISVINDVSDDEIFIFGDYNRLNQVFLNIIKNSIEAIDYNKKSYIKISAFVDSSDVKIIVEDNGIGMSLEVLEKVAEPFYTTKSNGTGLGVLLSTEIISAHKGSLKYESEEGVGTCAVITLPLYNELAS